MAVKQLPTLSPIPEPPNRLVGDQERFDTMTFNSLKAQEKMVNVDLNQNVIPALNQFAVDVNASVDTAKASETSALASKNSAASSAGTATTKAGEAAASAKAAKTSETSALASKNAASSSATAAANAQKAAEAARDEAQDLANVGYASESRAGLAKVDGKTTQAAADGAITVKDVAIGGDLGDLASARGQIGDNIRINTASDLNAYTKAGNWLFSDAAAEINFPTAGKGGELNCYVSTSAIFQFFTEFNNNRRYIRYGIPNSEQWSGWVQFVSVAQIGDGIRTTKGIISVPEYDGATTSTAGTGGLVPPAAAGQQDMVLTGSGKWVVPPAETFRLSMIGVPRYWRSTTLPVGHVWANGDLALFADWPELKKIYDAGGFAGMLLAYNANSATIAANLGKWRPNAANPTGLYVPNLSEQFFRAWTGVGQAGLRVADMGRNLTASWTTGWITHFIPTILTSGAAFTANEMAFEASSEPGQKVNQPFHVGIDAGRVWGTEHVGTEFAPTHVQLPAILYLGLSA